MRRLIEKLLTSEKALVTFVAVFCTVCTVYMVLFVNEDDLTDAVMIALNGLIALLAAEVEDK